MERHPGDALADALGDQRLHSGLGTAFGAGDPNPSAVPDAARRCIRRIDLDEHVLLELGQPFVGARLLAASFIFDQAPRSEDERELPRNALVDRSLLNGEAYVREPELR